MSKRKKTDPEFEPEVIDENWDDEHFLAFVPQQIEADWPEKWGPLLKGLPLNILFAAIRNDAQTGQQSVAKACYWPDRATFGDSDEGNQDSGLIVIIVPEAI